MLLRHLYRLPAIAGLADDVKVRLLLEDVAQGPADEGMIVYQEDPGLLRFSRFQFGASLCRASRPLGPADYRLRSLS